jgi:hypothetical protein
LWQVTDIRDKACIWDKTFLYEKGQKTDVGVRSYRTEFVQHCSAGENIVPSDTFYAYGWGGQYIVVIPSLDVVVVQLGFDEEDYPLNFTKPVWRDLISAFRAPAA